MKSQLDTRLSLLADADSGADSRASIIAGGRKGIEKESLRIDADGYLSDRPHPKVLGSALTNRFITTDFSEALLEFVTPAFENTWEALRSICDIHQFTYENLGDELIWVTSMPCRLPSDENIPLARYGDSNVGRMKTTYRRGLGHRYGRHMQTIAGVHFNYSLPLDFWPRYQEILGDSRGADEFRSDHYLGLVRNFNRYGWILLYLFGASPALCKSFAGNMERRMRTLKDDTWFEPFGTSLRMSDLGYNNKTQSRLNIGLNSIEDYIRDLYSATRTREPGYEKIGVKVDGGYRQLNANLLQIENEYYSSIRPKRVARSGERPTTALARGGIEYVEIRSLDISVFDPCGINQNAMRFIEAFLIYCLVETSPLLDDAGLAESGRNQLQTARSGRDPALMLYRDSKAVSLTDWAHEILRHVAGVAELVDRAETGDSYGSAVRAMQDLVDEPDSTPSARLLGELRDNDTGFFDFAFSIARGHRDYFRRIAPLSAEKRREFEEEARESLERQRIIEETDNVSFDDYLEQYFAAGPV